MPPLSPPLDGTHVTANKAHFSESKYQPDKVLEAQKGLWRALGVNGAKQNTAPENFLVIGEPFSDNGKFYSKIFNSELFKPYKEPSLTPLNNSDTCANVKKLPGGVVWEHEGDDEGAVRSWYAGIGAEAKGGRVLFNLHYKDSWEALFHEPVHEAAPDGGIGTSPRWTYEGYCEIFARQLAVSMGFNGYNIESGPYGSYAREVQKMIDFTSEAHVARAYFVNDEWSYSLLAPLWYKATLGHDISGNIAHYIPTDVTSVPTKVDDLLKAVKRNPKPEWYKRWVGFFGTTAQMPPLPAVRTLGGMPNPGGPPKPGGPPPMLGGPPKPGGPPPVLGAPKGPGIALAPQVQQDPNHTTTTLTLNAYMKKFWAVDR